MILPSILEAKDKFGSALHVQEKNFKELLRRAYASPFYRKAWRASGFKPDRFRSFDDLGLLPFVSRKELFEATRTMRSKISLKPVSHWFMGYDIPEAYEWFPYGVDDVLGIAPMLAKLSNVVGLREEDIVLAIVDVPPKISSFIPYFWSSSEASKTCMPEFIAGSMDWYDTLGMTWINFMQKRQPTVIFSSVRNAQALAERIQKTMKAKVKDILPNVRKGIFYGTHVTPDISKLSETYSVESFAVYSPTEHMSFSSECGNHRGIHLWLDRCVPEVIPTGKKEACPIGAAAPGTVGELVITNFASCLPLVRFKTKQLIRVEGTDNCSCGHNDPRISFCG